MPEQYPVDVFIHDLLQTFNQFLPYVLTAAVIIGVINFTVGAIIHSTKMKY